MSMLKLLNARYKTRFHSILNLIAIHPSAIGYIPQPSLEEYTSFFNSASHRTDIDKCLVERCVMDAIMRFPSVRGEENLFRTLSLYPTAINEINKVEKSLANALFMRAVSRKRMRDREEGLSEPLICSIENPGTRMKIASARMEPDSIKFMDQRTLFVTEAIRNKPSVIKYIDHPTSEQIRLAIGLDVNVLGILKEQSAADARFAMSLNPNAVKYVKPENRGSDMIENALTMGDNDLSFLNSENFESYRFSEAEINLMLKLGGQKLVALIVLMKLCGKLKTTPDLDKKLEKYIGGEE